MNNRIEELAEQAAYDTCKEHNNPYWRMQDEIPEDATWRQRFAELLIKECCSIVMADKVISWADSIRICGNIKEEFGVE